MSSVYHLSRRSWLALVVFVICACTIALAQPAKPTNVKVNAGLAMESQCPGGSSPDPNVVMCDNFEDGSWLDDWSASPYVPDVNNDGIISDSEREAVICGAKGFNDNCAAWTGEHNGFYAEKSFGNGLNELYVRWYVYISDPFRWDPVGDKNMVLTEGGNHTLDPYVVVNLWGTGMPFVISYANGGTSCVSQPSPNQNGEYPECANRQQNVGNDITLQRGTWYLFEWYVKLNDPDVPNGITKLWVDDASSPVSTQTLRTSYSDVVFRTIADTGLSLQWAWLSSYHNTAGAEPTQYQKWDNIVISVAPIGPL